MCCWGKGLDSLVVARFSGRGEEGVVAFPHPQELLLLLGEHLGLVLSGMDCSKDGQHAPAAETRRGSLARRLTRRSRQSSRRQQTLLWTGRDRPGLQGDGLVSK